MLSSQLSLLTAVLALTTPGFSLTVPEYKALKTSLNASILQVTFHNPSSPVNLWNQDTQNDLTDLVSRLQNDNETKVVIFNSDVPRFFVAHLDLSMPALADPGFVDEFGTLMYNISTLRQVTIGAVEGRARGAGNELLVALDMRFATTVDTVFGQPEVGSGLFPGGGGSQYLPGLIGRGRAMEYILSSKDISAAEAEKIGWINKAFETSADLYDYIDKLAARLSLFPLTALHGAKRSINRAAAPSLQNIVADSQEFYEQQSDPLAQEIAQRSSNLITNETAIQVELNLADAILQLYA